MRYVIIVLAIAGFVVWDSVSNGGQATDAAIRMLRGLLTAVGI